MRMGAGEGDRGEGKERGKELNESCFFNFQHEHERIE